MHRYMMNSFFSGKTIRKLLAAAVAFLILVVLTQWTYPLPGNLVLHMEETGSTRQQEGPSICPPVQDDPVSRKLSMVQPNSPCFRCNGRHHEDGRWFNFSSPSIRFLVYSAIFDDRSGLASAPVIRIIAVADPVDALHFHCLLHHDNGVLETPLEPEPLKIGSGWGLNGKNAQEYIFSCSAGNVVPFSVSIVEVNRDEKEDDVKKKEEDEKKKKQQHQNQTKTEIPNQKQVEKKVEVKKDLVHESRSQPAASSCIPVQVPVRPAKRDDFAVCVPVAHKSIDPFRLIEWFELQRILGVTLVGVAHINLNRTSLAILEHYRREGFLDLHRTDNLTLYPDKDHRRLHSTPTINDCVLRHMHSFNWILVLDFDEFILPRRQGTLRELVEYLDAKQAAGGGKPATGYVFRNNYFFLELEPDQSISSYFTVLRHRKRVPVSGKGYSVKSMINPRTCSGMHNHICWGRLAGYSTYAGDVQVDVEDGLNQHYKNCHFSDNECQMMMQNVTHDDTMLRFKDQLTSRVREKVKEIMGRDI